jgi:DNA-binding GntR family transcriptional regulator
VDQLRGLILEGVLKPGSRLSERLVQERYDVARTPLREALKVLAAEGLVDIAPNRGAIVTKLTLNELQAAYELLAILDGSAGEMACTRATDEQVAHIEQLHNEMVDQFEAGNLPNYFKANKAIHLAIVDAAGNVALSRIYRSESARVDQFRYAGNRDRSTWVRSVRQHEQILDALRSRQGSLLRESLISHRRSGWELAQSVFDLIVGKDETLP